MYGKVCTGSFDSRRSCLRLAASNFYVHQVSSGCICRARADQTVHAIVNMKGRFNIAGDARVHVDLADQ